MRPVSPPLLKELQKKKKQKRLSDSRLLCLFPPSLIHPSPNNPIFSFRSFPIPAAPFPSTMSTPHSDKCNQLAAPMVDGVPLSAIAPSPFRQAMPPPAHEQKASPDKPNLWSILKEALGKDITRISLPVYFNEPISFLQRLTEDVEHSYLLDQAAQSTFAGSVDRIALVAAFVISHYAATAQRPSKPFNPLLGETFDLILPDRGLAVIAEQVSHHPPVSALHAIGHGWKYHTAHKVRSRFHPNSLEVWPEGSVHIEFDDGDHYVYEQAHTFVHNIILGDLWIDNGGTITIRDVARKRFCAVIKLRSGSSFFGETKTRGEVVGKVIRASNGKDSSAKTLRKISGNWNRELKIDGRVVWRVKARPGRRATGGYSMTDWAWAMNSVGDGIEHVLPCTDSRFRPDQRLLEDGFHRNASAEKDRLEAAQRRRRREGESGQESESDTETETETGTAVERSAAGMGGELRPRWFELADDAATGKKEWRYGGEYFKTKAGGPGNWPADLPDIFGLEDVSN